MSKFFSIAAIAAMCIVGGCKSDDGMSSSSSKTKMSSTDACTKCAGMQTASAQGMCPGCGAKLH